MKNVDQALKGFCDEKKQDFQKTRLLIELATKLSSSLWINIFYAFVTCESDGWQEAKMIYELNSEQWRKQVGIYTGMRKAELNWLLSNVETCLVGSRAKSAPASPTGGSTKGPAANIDELKPQQVANEKSRAIPRWSKIMLGIGVPLAIGAVVIGGVFLWKDNDYRSIPTLMESGALNAR